MNPKTLKALKASIAHWRRMATGRQRKGEMPTGEHCALCLSYSMKHLGHCMGCPVMEQTGREQCSGSPWLTAYEAFLCSGFSDTFRAAAKLELKFLESLLPKRKGKA